MVNFIKVFVVVGAFFLAGTWDYASAIDADTAAKERREASIATSLSFPLPWTATVIQSGHGIQEMRVRYYVPKEKQ